MRYQIQKGKGNNIIDNIIHKRQFTIQAATLNMDMFHAMWDFTQSADCVAQWLAMVDPNYYTDLADHYSSSSDQLAIARKYGGEATVNCIVKVLSLH